MKKVITIYFIIFCFAVTSCNEEFLDTTDPTRIGSELFYKDLKQMQQALNGVYGQLQGITNTAYLYKEFNTDNTTLDFSPVDRGGAVGWEAFEFSTVNSGTPDISNLWNSYYSALYNINFALEKLAASAGIDEASKAEVEGQLKFLRAYFYFDLILYFGDVVLVTSTLDTPDEAFDLLRSPEADVYAQVISDLNDAVALLPASYPAAKVGSATKGAALGLLGKVYLTRKQYAEAESTLRQVLTLGYTLNPNYADNFNPTKKNGVESIFEVQYQGDNDLGEQSNFLYVFVPRLSQGAITGFPSTVGGGRNIPTNDIIADYEPGDLRKDISLKEGYTNSSGVYIDIPYVNKFTFPHTIVNRTNSNWPVLRYADVLLMLAETINEQAGPTQEAFDFMNAVRDRADLAPLTGLDKDAFRDAVLHERRIELAFENHRWLDLKRTKTPEQLAAFMNAYGSQEKANPTVDRGGISFNALDYVYEPHEYLFPVPAAQILINNKLTQNFGY